MIQHFEEDFEYENRPFSPFIGERQPRAWEYIVWSLLDLDWHWVRPIVDEVMSLTQMKRQSVINLMRHAEKEGVIERRTKFHKKKGLWNVYEIRLLDPVHPWARPVWELWENKGTNT